MRVGMSAYATRQGLGYLAKSFFDAGVIDTVLLIYHGQRTTYLKWYGNKALPITSLPIPSATLDPWLDSIDVFLCFETPFDWNIPHCCRNHGVKSVCMPMYEWFPDDARHKIFDMYLCPSALDCDYFPNNPLFTPPVDPNTWKLREKATRFLHNAGNLGHHFHKGTVELLKALDFIKSDLVLTVRCQDVKEFNVALRYAPNARRSKHLDLQLGEIPYENLFKDHDVYVAPEKFNGLSLPLQEAYAAGMLVMTSDRYPHNTWLPNAPLIPVESYHESRIGPSYHKFQSAIVNPKTIAQTMDAWYGRDITEFSMSGRQWANANSWATKRPKLLELLCP